jgi:PAS domain S-box-containing protein/putative nucleotidyltransferase with HDIG domain
MSLALTGHDPTWQVEGVASGEEALRHLAEEEAYDLVFLDYSLPQRNGLEVLEQIRQGEAPPPVVVVTVRGDEQVALEAMKAGAYDYVVKGKGYLQRLPVVAQRAMEAHRLAVNRKLAEEALLESEERYRRIVETAYKGIWMIDAESKTTYANNRMAEMLGYTVDEMKGKPLFDFMDEEWKAIAEALVDRHRQGFTEQHDFKFRRKDGTELWAIVATNPFFDREGRYAGALEMITDVTERKQAEEELQQSLEKLQSTLEGTVNALISAIEMRDPYTAGHQPRVTQLACAMAKEMGLPEEQIEGIRMAGLIHDIGKMTVPAEILSKPGPLTELEYGLIKAHAQVGHDILNGKIDFPWPVAEIVLQHHERMDGSGYPQGLAGEEILLEARILAVADVVEAMASHRPYRPAHGLDKALEEISQNSGVLYDPQVVNACLKLFTEKGFKLE